VITETDTTPANEADARRAGNEVLADVLPVLDAMDGDDPDQLPDGYLLVVALRVSDETCTQCEDDDEREPHRITELAVLNQAHPEHALHALSTAMRKIGEDNGISVGLVDPRQLAGLMAMAAMGPRMGRPDDDDDTPAPNTGQYL
jgi:hypothetical protein